MGVIHLWLPEAGWDGQYHGVYISACAYVAACTDDMPEFNMRVTCKRCKKSKPGVNNDLRPMAKPEAQDG